MPLVFDSLDDAIADLADGDSIMFGGFGPVQDWALGLIDATYRKGTTGLTAICNSPGQHPSAVARLIEARRVTRFIASFGTNPYRATPVSEQAAEGTLEYIPVPQGTLVERIRAAAAGIAAFYTPTGAGTLVADGKETRRFGDREFLLEEALFADFAFIRAWKADLMGNLIYRGGTRNFNRAMAGAARVTIAEVNEIVETGDLDPEAIQTPGIFVDRIVRAPVDDTELLLRFTESGTAARRERPEPLLDGKPVLTPELMAIRAANLLKDGDWVNLGYGLPALVAQHLYGRDIHLHAENGIANFAGAGDAVDLRFYNAMGQPVSPLPGAAFFDSADAFLMARGGHLDATILGAYEVSEAGDLANWWTPRMAPGGMGGAMDLCVGAKQVIVMMQHTTREGAPRVLRECHLPVTARGVVSWIVTDLALIRPTPAGLVLEEVAPGWTLDEIQARTEPALLTPSVQEMRL